MKSFEEQYLELGQDIIENGVWIKNERTGKECLTVVNKVLTYDASDNKFPLITTRKAYWRSAIAEMIGYLRGYDNAEQFGKLGSNTWFDNANKTKAWLANPARKGENDLGRVYGAIARKTPKPDGGYVDQVKKVFDHLKQGIDDRGEIISFWAPEEHHLGALRACMHTHTFSILGDTLHLCSLQRSWDHCLGGAFNGPQTVFLLRFAAAVSGLKAGTVTHVINNAHIYSDQVDLYKEQMKRTPFAEPKFYMSDKINSLVDIESWVDPKNSEHFWVEGYEHHDPIKYPFSE